MRCAILIKVTFKNLNLKWNNFNTQTITLHAIPNGGKMLFRAAFLNRIVYGYFDHNDTR
jgi:hypothetical protein